MSRHDLSRETIVPFIADIFDRRGAEEYLGEPVSMAEHMLQGAWLAEAEGRPRRDGGGGAPARLGHYTSEFGLFARRRRDKHHDEAGAEVLAPFFRRSSPNGRLHVAGEALFCGTIPLFRKAFAGFGAYACRCRAGR